MSFDVKVRECIAIIKGKLPFILAAIIILLGIYGLCVVFFYIGIENTQPGDICAGIVQIVMGFLIIFDPKRSTMRAVGFYAMSLGLGKILSSLSMAGSSSSFIFIVALVMIGLGVNLVYSGYTYLNDTSRGRFGMTMSSALMCMLIILTIAYETVYFEGTESTLVIIGYFIGLVQYLLILLILDSEEFRFSTWHEKAIARLEKIRTTYSITPGTYISREDAKSLKHMFDDRSSWSSVNDNGPVECEKRLKVFDGRIPAIMILQKWKGSDKIFVTMVNDDEGTILQANRFCITDVIADDDDDSRFMNVRLYSEGRMLSNISVMKEVAA